MSKEIVLFKKNLFFFNIFNSNFKKKPEFIKPVELMNINYGRIIDIRYIGIVNIVKRKKYNFTKKIVYKKKKINLIEVRIYYLKIIIYTDIVVL